MKIVLDNIIFSLQKAGGISTYWASLVQRLQQMPDDAQYYGSHHDNLASAELRIDARQESSLPTCILRYLPFTKKITPGSIFHGSYYRYSTQKDIKNIVTVHDFTYELFISGIKKWIHVWQKRSALRAADGIICVSESTKNDLVRLYPETQSKEIRVIHNGVSEKFYPLESPTNLLLQEFPSLRNKKFIMVIGSRAAYKNFDMALRTLALMPDYHLVIVGGGNMEKSYQAMLDELLSGRYHHILGANDETLNVLYNNAFALLHTSWYEGFGIPLIEAMRAGCPVVAANNSSIPEVADSAALRVTMQTPEKFAEKLHSLETLILWDTLRQRGFEQAKKFSWEKCFQETYRFYQYIDQQPKNLYKSTER